MSNDLKWTTNYSMFKTIDGNRRVGNTLRLEKSMKEHGVLPVPIIVNDKFEVIDGQHRLKAAEKLGLSVPYMVYKNADIDDCILMNNTSKPWEMIDYINSYAERGYPAYVELRQLLEKYNSLPQRTIIDIGFGAGTEGSAHLNSIIKTGNYCFHTSASKLEDTFDNLLKFKPYLSNAKGRPTRFYNALVFCVKYEGVTFRELLDAFRKYGSIPEFQVGEVAGTSHAISYIEKIYNYKKKGGKKSFLADYEYRAAHKNWEV